MTILQILALTFIIWEVLKIIFPKIQWKQSKAAWLDSITKDEGLEKYKSFYQDSIYEEPEIKKENKIIKFISYIYITFTIILLFTPFRAVGIGLILLSVIAALGLFPYIKKNEKFNFKIFSILFLDFVFSVLLLAQIYNPLELIQ